MNSRIIKFRGRRFDNGEWVYGSLLRWPDGDCTILESKDGKNYVWKREIEPNTVGQYTGLRDKDGMEIYEGDLLCEADTGKIVVVIYDAPEFCYKQNAHGYRFLNHPENFEVVGNIPDNPELLR